LKNPANNQIVAAKTSGIPPGGEAKALHISKSFLEIELSAY
jgi:hypothetical protein